MLTRTIRRTVSVLAVTIAAVGLTAIPAAADTGGTATPVDSAWEALADVQDTVTRILSPKDSAW